MLRNNNLLFRFMPVLDNELGQLPAEETTEERTESEQAQTEEQVLAVLEGPLTTAEDSQVAIVESGQEPEPVLKLAESAKAFGVILAASLPVLGVAAGLRLWDFSQSSAYMDEASYIVTGRLLVEHNQIYADALHWTFGSLLYPVLAGLADQQGGLVAARALSLGFSLVSVLATILLTLGLFKKIPQTKEQARADFTLGSKPVMASLLAGLVVAVLPTAIALGQFATYDAMAAAMFVSGCATYVWARREAKLASLSGVSRTLNVLVLFGLAATFFFLAFLAKYVVAIYFPFLCLAVLFAKQERIKALLSFVLPLSLACVGYYLAFSSDLTSLLQFSNQYHDLQSNDFLREYVFNRPEIIVLLLVGYWGLRQAFRDARYTAPLLLWGGAIILIAFQLETRADYDFWKHSIYLIMLLAPLAGWLWSDWSWWDEQSENPQPGRVSRWWLTKLERYPQLVKVDRLLNGGPSSEKPGSYSLMATVAVLLVALGIFWSQAGANVLVSQWLSINPSVPTIQKTVQGQVATDRNSTVLIDDSALVYYLYDLIPTNNITTPFSNDYKNLKGIDAYKQAVTDQHYNLIILDGGETPQGKTVWSTVETLLKTSPAYRLAYVQNLPAPFNMGKRNVEIYQLLPKNEQSTSISEANQKLLQAATAPAPTTSKPTPVVSPTEATSGNSTLAGVTAAASTGAAVALPPTQIPVTTQTATATATVTATPAPTYPANVSYNFANGDEGWGALPTKGSLQPGTAVIASDDYKLDGHTSLKFTPKPDEKMYTVGANLKGPLHKIHLYVFIPADKADGKVRMGLYYFDDKWGWHDNGFQNEVVPGQWNELTWEVPANAVMQQFGLKIVGYSGSIYINGVTVQ